LADEIDTALPRPSRAKGGRPPYPTVLMSKILILQQLYNLADDALEYQLLRKGSANKPISDTQKQRNRRIATPRARVEHVFGAIRHMGGKLVRCMGIVRATFALHVKTASYNLQRLVYLKERGFRAF
jgi:IS5 family transposase